MTTEDGEFSAQCVVAVLAAVLEEERELPHTGGYPYYALGLLALAAGIWFLSKRKTW